MKKLKGQSRLTQLLASRLALSNRNKFSTIIRDIQQLKQLAERVAAPQTVAFKLVSFSSSKDYPEQVLSILSFLRHLGTPLSWTIYSDGSHSDSETAVLQNTLPFVQIIRQDVFDTYFIPERVKSVLHPYRQELQDFATRHVLGKKLFLFLNHTVDEPTLFLDSDIIFYAKSSTLKTSVGHNGQGWFLPDEVWGSLDHRYVADNEPEHYQVNAGFFLMKGELANLDQGLRFLKSLEHKYEYFTEQTIIHILLNVNRYMPLDPRLFVLDNRDQFDFSYAFTRDKIAIRHYTSPVRHKMWQRDWKWQLSLT